MALRAKNSVVSKNSIISVNEKTDKYWNSSSKIQSLIPKNHIIYLKLKNILKFDFPYDLHQLNIFSGFSYSTFFRVFIGNKKNWIKIYILNWAWSNDIWVKNVLDFPIPVHQKIIPQNLTIPTEMEIVIAFFSISKRSSQMIHNSRLSSFHFIFTIFILAQYLFYLLAGKIRS